MVVCVLCATGPDAILRYCTAPKADRGVLTPYPARTMASQLRATFDMSAGKASEFPSRPGEEFCVMGRSNVGKSSFINHVFARKGLARVSKTPGKTVLANFYRLDDGSYWVDLPGYGYARASRTEGGRLTSLLRDYCERREQLSGIILLVDVRHPGTRADLEAYQWLSALDVPILVVLTKCDKLSRAAVQKMARKHRSMLGERVRIATYSTQQSGSRASFWREFDLWRTAGRDS